MAPIRGTRSLLAVLAFVLGVAVVPHRVCERHAQAFFDGDAATTRDLATSVARWTAGPTPKFSAGSRVADGEWTFATYTMAAMGFGQLAREHPEDRAKHLASMERAIEKALVLRGFDREMYGRDALADDHGHIAALGYVALPLALHRGLVPKGRLAAEDDRFIAAILRRYDHGLAETYPGVVFPVDNAPAIVALALHADALGLPRPPAYARGLAALRAAIDPKSGLLVQANGDGPRGSGTALAAYFLAFADPAMSSALHRALRGELFRTTLGFGGILEHPDGASRADLDSGPVVLGFGVSATGFAIGASRANGDAEMFRALVATAHLFGAPRAGEGYVTGGPLGDAILFAMLTAPRPV